MFNEVHSIHGHTLLLITKPSLQATALLQHLKQSLAITGKLHNIQRSLDDISSGSIILLDMMEADKKLIHYWQDTLSRKNNNIKILLLNTPEDYPYRDIEKLASYQRRFLFHGGSRTCCQWVARRPARRMLLYAKACQLPDYAFR
ncbi:csgab operon transcriptional regulator [Escherichia coli]|uniref:Csgab operon transcriptional regulator n=1 Tax=Escherichia coli TaxID=562 RepID=A0A377E5I8_ECOLX|nr:csgab operon transcriptional regulator [Escherichia coli]